MKNFKFVSLAGMFCLALSFSSSAFAEKKLSKEEKKDQAVNALLVQISALEIQISKTPDGTAKTVRLAQKFELEGKLEKILPTMKEARQQAVAVSKTEPETGSADRVSISAPKPLTPAEQKRLEILRRAQEIEFEKAQKKALKEEKRADTPAMKKAREEIEDREDAQKDARKELVEMRNRAKLTGCSWDTVKISKGAFDGDILENMIRIRITNTGSFFQDIETPTRGAGLVVHNLCPGGAITLTFSIKRWLDGTGGIQIPLTAKAQPPNASTVTEKAQYYLPNQRRTERIEDRTWEITTGRQH